MSKRILVIVLAITLVFVNTIVSFGTEVQSEKVKASASLDELVTTRVSATTMDEIQEDVELLSSLGLNQKQLAAIDATSNDSADYVYKYIYEYGEGTIDSYVKINQLANGNIEFEATEGFLHNKAVFTPDRRVFLEGEEVIFGKNTVEDKDTLKNNDMQVLPNSRYSYSTKKCPYGTAADYTKHVGIDYDPNIEFSQFIVDLTISFLGTILGTVLPVCDLAANLASLIIKASRATDSHSKALSYYTDMYYHKTKGLRVYLLMDVTYHVTTWYGSGFFKDKISTEKWFHVSDFS